MPLPAFFQACGGHAPIRVAIGSASPREFTAPVLLAGADRRCEIVLPDGPSKALAFFLVEGGLFALPFEPGAAHRNGRTCEADWVLPGDAFQVGSTELRLLNPDQPGRGELHFDPLGSGGATDSDLHFEPGPDFRSRKSPSRLAVRPRLMLIGRDEPCRFKINFDGVEPVHAAVLRTPHGPWLADLALCDSTLLNDGAVRAARLRDGDRLALGPVELIARVDGPRAPTALVAPTADNAVGPILQQVAKFQQQTFEQFREMLGSMTEMFGAVLSEHRQFVREEFARLDRSQAPAPSPPQLAAPAASPPPPPPSKYFKPATTSTPVPQPAPGYAAPPANVELHTWLQTQLGEQLGNLEKAQSNRWQRLVEKFRKK